MNVSEDASRERRTELLECMREYFEGKAERLRMKIRKLHEVGYDVDDISSILGLPEEIVEVVLR